MSETTQRQAWMPAPQGKELTFSSLSIGGSQDPDTPRTWPVGQRCRGGGPGLEPRPVQVQRLSLKPPGPQPHAGGCALARVAEAAGKRKSRGQWE